MAVALVRSPIRHDGTSLVSAQIAVEVHTSPAFLRGPLRTPDALLLRVDERPDFVHLDATARQIAQHPILLRSAGFRRVHEQLGDGVLRHVRDTRRGPHAHAFHEALKSKRNPAIRLESRGFVAGVVVDTADWHSAGLCSQTYMP